MYSSISELPSQVRSSLDEHDQTVYLETYNSLNPATESEVKEARVRAWEACKDLPSSFSFCITASVDEIDRQREVVDMDSIRACLDSFIDYGGNVQDEHGDYCVGTIWKWEPVFIDGRQAVNVWGNVFGGDDVYDKARKAFVNGKNSLSIAGEADNGRYTCDERGCYMRRTVQQLMEISLCTIPCNPLATLVWYNDKANLTKSVGEGVHLSVDMYEIHKDAQFCPVQAVKKALLAVGIECHATSHGVEVPLRYESRIAKSETLGYVRKGDVLVVQTKRRMAEKAYGNCLRKGYVTTDGAPTESMPESVRFVLESKGLMVDGRVRTVF